MQANQLRILQILILAMASGLLAFTVLGLVLGPQTRPPAGNVSTAPTDISQLLLMVLGGMGFTSFVLLGFVIRPMMAKSAAQAWQARHAKAPTVATEGSEGQSNVDGQAAGQIWRTFQVRTIVSGAMIEGIGLFAAVINLLTGAIPALIGVGVALLGIAWTFPTRHRWRQFVEFATQAAPGASARNAP